MSVYSQIVRITGLRDRIASKLISLGLIRAAQRAGDNNLEDCTDAIEAISGTQAITTTHQYDVAGKQYAQVSDANLVAQNIAQGVTILGITGTHSGSTPPTPTQSKDIILGTAVAPSTVYPDSGYLLSAVTPVMGTPAVLLPENIKQGVTIMGVTGTYGSTYEVGSAPVTIINQGEIQMQVNFNSLSQIIFLNVVWIDSSAAYVNGLILSARVSLVGSNSFGMSVMYIDTITSKVEYQNFNVSLTSNGRFTITLPVNSACNFGNSYFCTYCYTN